DDVVGVEEKADRPWIFHEAPPRSFPLSFARFRPPVSAPRHPIPGRRRRPILLLPARCSMKCPYCGHADTRVTNSRVTPEGDRIRRRRECEECGQRFTTFESIERGPLFVIKRNGTRQEFNPEK